MAGKATFLFLHLLASAVASTAAAATGGSSNNATSSSSSPTAYEILEQYNFPRGILPEGVTGYSLSPDGSFEVYFPRKCEFLLSRTWLVRYDASIAGAAAAGKLTALSGVSVKVLFLWIPVGEVDRAGDQLSFYVGPVATSFPIGDFADSPKCRGDEVDGAAAASS